MGSLTLLATSLAYALFFVAVGGGMAWLTYHLIFDDDRSEETEAGTEAG
jgi:hypothetical protein